MTKTRYEVIELQAGQPRAYADTEYEYLIKIVRTGWGTNAGIFEPWTLFGGVEARVKQDDAMRLAGTGGRMSVDEMNEGQRDWAKKIVRALCRNFREHGDDDGMTGMDAHFYPTLKRLDIDAAKGEIRALIVEAYND